MKKEFKSEYIPTVVDSYEVELGYSDRKCTLELVDTAGQENFDQIRKINLQGAHGKAVFFFNFQSLWFVTAAIVIFL